jgi:hypothetical protein
VRQNTDLTATNPYPFPCTTWSKAHHENFYHLWYFTAVDNIYPGEIRRPWREILNEIVGGIVPDDVGRNKFKASINGVTSNANGMVRTDRQYKTIVAAMLQRLHASAVEDWRYQELVSHPLFHEFYHARAADYLAKHDTALLTVTR